MCAAQLPLESFCPHFSTNMPIIWNAPMTNLPNSFWLYRRLPPRPFSASVISNAIILASLQSKGFPKSSTNDFFIPEDRPSNYPGMVPIIFEIRPNTRRIFFGLARPDTNTQKFPADKILMARAWDYAIKLGVDPTQVAFENMTSRFNQDENYNDLTNELCGRGVYLSRLLDRIFFTNSGDNGFNGGFWIEFGHNEKINAFSLVWPDLRRDSLQTSANSQQIIECIRHWKTMSLPIGQETNYFERIKSFAATKKLIVTKITPYYWENIYGNTNNEELSKNIAPFAELEAVADFGNHRESIKLFSPIISSDVKRLLGTQK
jgi:hypothetical protein